MSQVNIQKVEDCLSKLQGSNTQERKSASLILGGLIPEDAWPIEPLVDALDSENDDLVFWSIIALGRLEHHAALAVEKISIIAKTHQAFGIRQVALSTLSKIAPKSIVARKAIFSAFTDDSPLVRREALQSSILVHEHTSEELSKIAAMSADRDKTVAAWSDVALRNIRIKLERKNAL
jgi:HEAT repeat protein